MKRFLCAVALSCTAHATPAVPAATLVSEPTVTPAPSPTTSAPAANVSPDGPKLGSLDTAIIKKVVREHGGQLRWCYEDALTRTPGIRGKLIVKWAIDVTGDVVSTSVVQALHPEVDRCVAARIAGWKFPTRAAGGIVIINYPFVFKQVSSSSSVALEAAAAETSGSLSPEVVKEVVVSHREQVTSCLTASKRDDIAGTLLMKWEIDTSGAVARVSTVNSIGQPAFEACLTGVIAKWKFPEPTDGASVIVTYPFGITKTPSSPKPSLRSSPPPSSTPPSSPPPPSTPTN